MKSVRILISGSVLSGRTVFLNNLLAAENRQNSFERNLHSLPWKSGDCSFNLEIMKARFSQGDYYLNRINHTTSLDVQDEIDFIRQLDGIVFVIDSQKERIEAGVADFRFLRQALKDYEIDISDIPIVFTANKCDLPNICSIEEIKKVFVSSDCSYVESISIQGIGVTKSLDELVKMINKTEMIYLSTKKAKVD